MLRLALAFALVTSAVATAVACPPGPCNKYRHMIPQTIVESPTQYTRTLRGAPPGFSFRGIVAFLASSTWDPTPTLTPPQPNLRFVPAPRIRFALAADARRPTDPNVRLVLIRRIERRAGLTLVELDGQVFALSRCGTWRAPTACLDQRADINLDEPVDETTTDGGRFAKPPGAQ